MFPLVVCLSLSIVLLLQKDQWCTADHQESESDTHHIVIMMYWLENDHDDNYGGLVSIAYIT